MKPNFSDPEVWAQLEQLAYDGSLDCSEFPPAEYRYFTELAKLRKVYQSLMITRETAERQKLKLLKAYREALLVNQQALAAYKEHQDNIRKIGTLRTAIERETDERERLRLCILAIGAMTGDKVFQHTQLQRLDDVSSIS